MADTDLEGVDLLSLAGLDISGLDAKRMGDAWPRMFADFRCTSAELKDVKDTDTGKVKMFIAEFNFECLGVHKKIDEFDENSFIGKTYREAKIIQNTDGIKYLIGFMEDIGNTNKGALKEVLELSAGLQISAIISHRKSKDDPDRVYTSLSKIKPV